MQVSKSQQYNPQKKFKDGVSQHGNNHVINIPLVYNLKFQICDAKHKQNIGPKYGSNLNCLDMNQSITSKKRKCQYHKLSPYTLSTKSDVRYQAF